MKCKMCRQEKAIIRLHSYNFNLCHNCFDIFFIRRVEKGIKSFSMFNKESKILLAVSGGKDSLVLWHVLKRLNYNVDGLYIDLGIGEYSEKSKQLCLRFASENRLKLIIESVRERFNNNGIIDLNKIIKKKACSICGTVKRYIFNQIALINNYDVIATGHNLDDEAATLFGNLSHWQVDYLNRQYPVLPSHGTNLKTKVKPLIYCSEYETTTYAITHNIQYITEECPLSKNATSLFYKHILNQLEYKQRGFVLRFVKGFFKNRSLFTKEEQKPKLNECKICGSATTSDICNYCRMKTIV